MRGSFPGGWGRHKGVCPKMAGKGVGSAFSSDFSPTALLSPDALAMSTSIFGGGRIS